LIEGRSSPGGPRPFGYERLLGILDGRPAPLGDGDLEEILAAARTANGGPMPDDVIMLAVSPA
jgi:hypothetical protein